MKKESSSLVTLISSLNTVVKVFRIIIIFMGAKPLVAFARLRILWVGTMVIKLASNSGNSGSRRREPNIANCVFLKCHWHVMLTTFQCNSLNGNCKFTNYIC